MIRKGDQVYIHGLNRDLVEVGQIHSQVSNGDHSGPEVGTSMKHLRGAMA